jgi:hypothetical protein
VYVGGVFSHAAAKRPKVGGAEWKVNGQYGGDAVEIGKEELPTGATEVGERLCEWLRKKFGESSVGYMRLDGVLAEDDGGFVIGEVELIEPEIWLAKDQKRVERFVNCLLEEGKPQAA